jgi:hypothetical protein
MNFIQFYDAELKSSGLEYNLTDNSSAPIKDIADIIDGVVDSAIRKQELSLTGFPVNLQAAFASSAHIRTTSVLSVFIADIIAAITIELTENWVTPWTAVKAAANLLLTPPAGPGFPASLYFTSPLPVGPAIAGANMPFSDGGKINAYFQNKKSFYRFDYIQLFAKALSKFVAQSYIKYAATGSKPYLPL